MQQIDNIDVFLNEILNQVIDSTNSDAGTLYLKEGEHIKFHLVENRTLETLMHKDIKKELTNLKLPLSKREYVAVEAVHRCCVINVKNVYESTEFDFSGNKFFDAKLGYKTHSMLVIPLKHPQNNEVLCVLQLFNKINQTTKEFESYTSADESLAYALGKISALAIVQVKSYIAKLIEANTSLQSLTNSLEEKVATRTNELKMLSSTDYLTGVNNRRVFFELGHQIFETQKQQNLFIAITDIDKFKQVNDTFGHQAGDFILQEFSKIFLKFMLPNCIFARIGGEEFAIIYPSYTQEDVEKNIDMIKQQIQQCPLYFEGQEIHITTSFGFSQRHVSDKNIDEILARADLALYESKGSGRNAIRFRS